MTKTTEYRLEIEKQIEDLKNKNYEEEIKVQLKEYEEELRKDYSEKKEKEINKLSIKKECLIELEAMEEKEREAQSQMGESEESIADSSVEAHLVGEQPSFPSINN